MAGPWTSKSAETLEMHVKEKHTSDGVVSSELEGSSSSSSCSYCSSSVDHPRLSRGEHYPCGFKPYRCDLCLYSTTTKGNLAIHMQSDKHLNNCKDGNSTPSSHSGSTPFALPSPSSRRRPADEREARGGATSIRDEDRFHWRGEEYLSSR